MTAWQSFVLGLAPYVVTLSGLILAAFWGREVLAAKDAQLAAKDEQLAAKDEQLKTLGLMAPERVVENLKALHAYYKDEVELTKAKLVEATDQLTAAGTESQALHDEVNRLRERLEIFEFGTASTASAFLATPALNAASLSALMETVNATSVPLDYTSLWSAAAATTLMNPAPMNPARKRAHKRKSNEPGTPTANPESEVEDTT